MLSALVLSCLVALGCSQPTGVESGLDASTPTKELSDDARLALCEATLDYSVTLLTEERYCFRAGWGSALQAFTEKESIEAGVRACEAALQTCAQEFADRGEAEGQLTFCSFGIDCDGTVSQAERCQEDIVDQVMAQADSWDGDCGFFDAAFLLEPATQPASCTEFGRTCPGFVEP